MPNRLFFMIFVSTTLAFGCDGVTIRTPDIVKASENIEDASEKLDPLNIRGAANELAEKDREIEGLKSMLGTDKTASESKQTYRLRFSTAQVEDAGTDATVFVQLIGSGGKSEKFTWSGIGDKFEKGRDDEFEIDTRNIGDVKEVFIGHDNSNNKPGWLLKKLDVKNTETGRVVRFETGQWFAANNGDGKTERTLTATIPN